MNQSEAKWFTRVLGRELGPMSRERLERMVEDGEITADDEIRLAGESVWSSADSFVPREKQPDLVPVEPVVSTIAPLRIPRSASDERVHEIRQRAIAALNTPTAGTADSALFDSDLDELILNDDDSAPVSGDSEGMFSDDSPETPSPLAGTEHESRPVASNAGPAPSWSLDALFQGVGRAFRARSSRRVSSGPTLRDGLAQLIPTQLYTRANARLAAAVVVVCGIVWLLMPGYQATAFNQLGEMRQTVQAAVDDPSASNNWSNAMAQLRPEVVAIVDRMQVEATADDPPSQVLLWATTEMNAVVGGSLTGATEHLKKFDDLIQEYRQLTTGETPDGSEAGIVELPGGLR